MPIFHLLDADATFLCNCSDDDCRFWPMSLARNQISLVPVLPSSDKVSRAHLHMRDRYMKADMLVGYYVGGRLGGSASLNWWLLCMTLTGRPSVGNQTTPTFPSKRPSSRSNTSAVIFFNASNQPTASKSQVPLSYRQQFCWLKRRRPTLVLHPPEPVALLLLTPRSLSLVSSKRAQNV